LVELKGFLVVFDSDHGVVLGKCYLNSDLKRF
jgi:hypothetical protein